MKQLLLDISELARFDHRTGIQRVVRSIVTQLLADDVCSFRVEPVYYSDRKYVYARRFTEEFLGRAIARCDNTISDDTISIEPGDIFLGLDLSLNTISETSELLRAFRTQGVYVCFIVYDILPLLRPDWWPASFAATFSGWFSSITAVSDKLICISRATAEDVRKWLQMNPIARGTALDIGYFHLGTDFTTRSPTSLMPLDSADVMAAIAARPTYLSVGTIEPRKGYAQLLAGFDLLWARGIKANLVIVGKAGWMVDHLLERIRHHPQLGTQLFWLAGISDEYLDKLYAVSTGLIAASEGEGFGLPLIEAARYHVPIIARDLQVFREIAGESAYYFSGTAPEDLASAIATWIQFNSTCEAPRGARIRWLTWRESAQKLLEALPGPDEPDADVEISSGIERNKLALRRSGTTAEMLAMERLVQGEGDRGRVKQQTTIPSSGTLGTTRAETLRRILAIREADYQRLRVSAAEASDLLADSAEERSNLRIQQRRWLEAALPNSEDKLNVRALYRVQSQLYPRWQLRWLSRRLIRHARMLTAAADRARDRGRWELAARFYQEALELTPARASIWVQYGHTLKESGNLAAAERAYRKSLKIASNIADTHLQLGHVLKLQGKLDDAGDAYLCALRVAIVDVSRRRRPRR
jgi:glycosyltransferase involved in cell wall biosynthesis